MVVVPSSSSVGMQSDRQSVRDYQSEPGTSGTIDDLDEDSTDDGLNMGMPGEKYTTADRRLLAKYIATVEDWENKNDSERFENFHQRVSLLCGIELTALTFIFSSLIGH